MKFFFIPDKTIITISILCAIGIYFMITYVINAHIWYSTIPTILAIGLFIFFILKTPYCTYIEKETIIVKQVFGSIKSTDIKSIKPIKKTDLANTTRVLGNGGFLGYVGTFHSPKLGKFYMAAINKNELVKIVTYSGKIYVINYPHSLLEDRINE